MTKTPAKALAVVLISALAAGLCHLNALDGVFSFDDKLAVLQNAVVTGGEWDEAGNLIGYGHTPAPAASFWMHDYWGSNVFSQDSHKSFRPLTLWTFQWDWARQQQASGASDRNYRANPPPRGFHVTSVWLHVIVTALFAGLSVTLFAGRTEPALVASLLFAVHPTHVESVASIVGRAEVLSALFFLAAVLIYLHLGLLPRQQAAAAAAAAAASGSGGAGFGMLRRVLVLAATVLLSTLAMLAKETGVVALAVCVGLDVLVLDVMPQAAAAASAAAGRTAARSVACFPAALRPATLLRATLRSPERLVLLAAAAATTAARVRYTGAPVQVRDPSQ